MVSLLLCNSMGTAGCKAKPGEEQPIPMCRVTCAASGLVLPCTATQEEMKGTESFVHDLDLGLSSEE